MTQNYAKQTAERIAKIEERTKSIFQELRAIKEQMQISNGRTRTLEGKTNFIFGAGGVLVIAVPIVVNLLMGG